MKTPTIPAPDTVAALEKIPHAARRMGISTCQLYRKAKAGRLCIVKVGSRASAVSAAAVNAWIQSKIDAAQGAAK